jgi:hypothetical protein
MDFYSQSYEAGKRGRWACVGSRRGEKPEPVAVLQVLRNLSFLVNGHDVDQVLHP